MDLAKQKKQEWIEKNLTNTAPNNCNLKVGDLVEWVNDYGVVWRHKILGFNYDGEYNKEYTCYVHLDNDCYWFPEDHAKLKLIINN